MQLVKKTIAQNGRVRIYFLGVKILSYKSAHYSFMLNSLNNISNLFNNNLKNSLNNVLDRSPYRADLQIVADLIKNKYFYEHFEKEALLKNLDTESLKTITSVLSKLEYLANGGMNFNLLYDTEMKKYLSTTIENLKNSIQTTTIDDNEYIYIYMMGTNYP